jgi:hypothetical protein
MEELLVQENAAVQNTQQTELVPPACQQRLERERTFLKQLDPFFDFGSTF